MKPSALRIAVVGAGTMGRLHARMCASQREIRLAAIVDPHAGAGQALAADYGVPWLPASEALDPECYDAAIICTPTSGHLTQATWYIAAGKHVLVEKPHRLPWEDASQLAAALNARPDLVYMVGMTHRFYPEVSAARGALAEHPIGELLAVRSHVYLPCLPGTLPDWYFQPEHAGGGVLTTNGVHCLDRILWLSGRRTMRLIAAYGRTLLPGHQVEDLATVFLELEPAIPVHLSFLWTDVEIQSAQLELVGSAGVARINAWQGYELYWRGGHRVEQAYPAEATAEERTLAGLRAEVAAFAHACRLGEPSPVPLGDLEEVSHILSAAYATMSRATDDNRRAAVSGS